MAWKLYFSLFFKFWRKLSYSTGSIFAHTSRNSFINWGIVQLRTGIYLLSDFRLYFVHYFLTLRDKCPYSELFWSVFSCIRTEYGEILHISPYPVRMRENTDQNNSEYGHFLRSVKVRDFVCVIFSSHFTSSFTPNVALA